MLSFDIDQFRLQAAQHNAKVVVGELFEEAARKQETAMWLAACDEQDEELERRAEQSIMSMYKNVTSWNDADKPALIEKIHEIYVEHCTSPYEIFTADMAEMGCEDVVTEDNYKEILGECNMKMLYQIHGSLWEALYVNDAPAEFRGFKDILGSPWRGLASEIITDYLNLYQEDQIEMLVLDLQKALDESLMSGDIRAHLIKKWVDESNDDLDELVEIIRDDGDIMRQMWGLSRFNIA